EAPAEPSGPPEPAAEDVAGGLSDAPPVPYTLTDDVVTAGTAPDDPTPGPVAVPFPTSAVAAAEGPPAPPPYAVATASTAASPAVSWDTGPALAGLTAADPLPAFISEAVPFLSRGLASLRPLRRLGRVTRRKSLPKVEPLEPVRLLSCNV